MSDYTKTFIKTTGDTIAAADQDTEYTAISTAIATKANKIASPTANNVIEQDVNGDLVDTGLATPTGDFVGTSDTQTLTNKTIADAGSSIDAPALSSGQFGGAYVHLREEQTSGTEGGASSATTWHTRTLNTESYDTGSVCSLSSNQFTLSAGTYQILASAPCYGVNDTKVQLYNISDAGTEIMGQNAFAANVPGTMATPIVRGQFTIASSKTFEIRHYTTSSVTTWGLGQANGVGTEVYCEVELWKVK